MSIYLINSITGWRNSKTDPSGKDTSLLAINGLDRGTATDVLMQGTKPLFEWFHQNEHTKPYFDIDCKCADEETYNACKEKVLMDAIECLTDTYSIKREDLRISAYNGVEKSWLKMDKVKKYGAYIVSYHIVVVNWRTTLPDNKLMAAILKSKNDTFDTGVYGKHQLFRVAGHHKHTKRDTGCREPQLLYRDGQSYKPVQSAQKTVNGQPLLDFKYDHLINLADANHQLLEPHDQLSDDEVYDSEADDTEVIDTADLPPIHPIEPTDNVIDELLAYVPYTDCNDRGKWWYITKCIKSHSTSAEAKASWDAWSKQSKKYNKEENEKTWASITDFWTDGLERLRKKAKIIHDIHKAFESFTDESMCNLFIRLYGEHFRVVNYPKIIWMFDESDTLWKEVNKDFLNTFLTKHFAPLRNKYVELLNKDPSVFIGKLEIPEGSTDKEKAELEKKYEKAVSMLLSNIKSSQNTKRKCDYQKEFFTRACLQDPNFTEKLNPCPDVLSCKNGVLNIKENTFRKRVKKDYLSKCLELDWNPELKPDHDNEDFVQFITDILDADDLDTEEVVEYLQCALGYGITGNNNEQKCLIFFGCGSNGKSLLCDVLTMVLKCVAGTMSNTFNSNLFDDASSKKESANQASPELAKLVGCALGLVNESSEGLMFGEMFKKLVDNTQSLSYRQLNQPSQKLKLITKFIMFTNCFPNFPVEDCYKRRLQTIPFKMKFTADESLLDKPDKPNYRRIDTQLFTKMMETKTKKEAILVWLVEGARKYYANNKHMYKLPDCCEKYKQAYIANNDWARLFQKTEKETDLMPFDEISETINSQFSLKNLTKSKITSKLIEMGFSRKRKSINGRKVYVFTHIRPTNVEEETTVPYGFSSN